MARMRRMLLGAVLVALGAAQAGAYTVPRGERDSALMRYEDPATQTAAYMSLSMWGTGYYGGVPPREQGGLGDVVLCVEVFRADPAGDKRARGCFNEFQFTFDRLRSLTVEDALPFEVQVGDDEPFVETLAFDVTLTGTGPLYPGGRAQTNPSPGAEAEYSLMRNVRVSGTIGSPTLGIVDVAAAGGVLGHDACTAFMVGDDNVEACRF